MTLSFCITRSNSPQDMVSGILLCLNSIRYGKKHKQ